MPEEKTPQINIERVHAAEELAAPAPIPGMPAAISVLMTYLAKYGATPILLALFCFMVYSGWNDMRVLNKDNAVAVAKMADAVAKLADVMKDREESQEKMLRAVNRLDDSINRTQKPGSRDQPLLFSSPDS